MNWKMGLRSAAISRAVGWAIGLMASASAPYAAGGDIGVWTTSADRTHRLSRSQEVTHGPYDVTIRVDLRQRHQTIVGFGGTLTDGSIDAIQSLPSSKREQCLSELFSARGEGIKLNILRVPLGGSDLSANAYTYDDTGTPDPQLKHLDFTRARSQVMPMLQAIKRQQPDLVLMATPWTAPAWMKDNGRLDGGRLKREYQRTYAQYLVRCLEAFRDAGITFDYLTVQNEPLNGTNNPSMLMHAEEQAAFIGQHLGPALQAAGLTTRVLAYDHNCDRPDYPLHVLGDARATQFVAGSAFHLYGGKPDAMTTVHERFPEKEIHFTEQWTSADGDFGADLLWHGEQVLVGALHNWSRSVLEWNLAADAQQQPHTDGGCHNCLGVLTIDGDVTRNVAYYVLAHGSRFVPRGSRRVASSADTELPHVALLTPEHQLVIIGVNRSDRPQVVDVQAGPRQFAARAEPKSLFTLVTSAVNDKE